MALLDRHFIPRLASPPRARHEVRHDGVRGVDVACPLDGKSLHDGIVHGRNGVELLVLDLAQGGRSFGRDLVVLVVVDVEETAPYEVGLGRLVGLELVELGEVELLHDVPVGGDLDGGLPVNPVVPPVVPPLAPSRGPGLGPLVPLGLVPVVLLLGLLRDCPPEPVPLLGILVPGLESSLLPLLRLLRLGSVNELRCDERGGGGKVLVM